MSSDENVATLRRVIECIHEGDLDGVAEHVTEGFTRHDLSGTFLAARPGQGEVADFLHTLLAAIPDLHIDIADVMSCGDKMTVRYGFTGTHKGTLLDTPATGRALDFSGINIYRFEDAKVAEAWQLWDWATVLQQIGVLHVAGTQTSA